MVTVYTVRVYQASGDQTDLLLFEDKESAERYADLLKPLPLGFDRIQIVAKMVLGRGDLRTPDVGVRRLAHRTKRRRTAEGSTRTKHGA